MSEDFDVVCRTCTNAHPEKRHQMLGLSDWNRRWKECWLLVDAASAFSMLSERLKELSSEKVFFDSSNPRVVFGYDSRVDINWFNLHFGHDLGVRSEYQYCVDRDGKPIGGDPVFPNRWE